MPIGIVLVGLFCFCVAGQAQRAGGERPSRFMDRIDAEEGAAKLAAFRNQRLVGDFFFEFELEHKPRRARTVRHKGLMWGSWNETGPITRFILYPHGKEPVDAADSVAGAVELIVQNGPEPEAWIRGPEQRAFQQLEGDRLFEPILPGLFYSPFDLQMPFIYWDSYSYEGPALAMGSRVAQRFLMYPPEGSPSAEQGISGVRIGLDDTYDALLTIEVLGASGSITSRFAVESVKKVQEQYIVKRITLTDYPSKDRTTFDVEAASVGLTIGRNFFSPHAGFEVDAYLPESTESL